MKSQFLGHSGQPVVRSRLSLAGAGGHQQDRLAGVISFTIAGGKVVQMNIPAGPEHLSRLDLSAIEG